MKIYIVLILSLFLSLTTEGQGNYLPPNADPTFPRTLMDREDIDIVRTNVSSSDDKIQLYKNILQKAMESVPSGNITNNERRNRAWIAREAAFVYIINRKVENDELVIMSAIERQGFADIVISILETINTDVEVIEGFSFYYNWQFRTNELSMYLVAYDFLRGADIPAEVLANSAENLQLFTGNFYSNTLQLYPFPNLPALSLEFYSYNPNNHGVMYSSTLGLAGIVLGDLTSEDPIFQPISWINAGMWSLDHSLWGAEGVIPRVSERGVLAGYAESPNYFGYGFKNAFPFIRAMWNFLPDGSYDYTFRTYSNPIIGNGNPQTITKSIRHPWYDSDYYNIYEWMKRIRMPNGKLPAIHDSGITYGTALTSLSGQSDYHLPFNNISFNNRWVRTQYLCTPVSPGSYDLPLFQAMPASGDLIFRNTYADPTGTYMHLIGKNGIALYGAKAHHQADATSYQMYFNGENILLDPGYPGAPDRLAVASAASHNLVLVNGEGPGLVTGEFVNQNNEVFIENFFDQPALDYGELRGGWQGADITRKTMFVHDRFFVVSDFLRSSSPKDYTFQVHGNGLIDADINSIEGNFTENFQENKYTYTRGSDATLVSLTTARGGIDQFRTELDSAVTSGYRYHTKVLADKDAVNNTEFLTVHFPFSDGIVPVLTELTAPNDLTSAIHIKDAFYDNLVITNAADFNTEISFPITGIPVKANGNLNIVSLDLNQGYRFGFIENGDSLIINNTPIFIAEEKGDIYFEQISTDTFSGFVGQGGIVRFYNDVQLVPLSGAIDNFIFDENNGSTIITFVEEGDFILVADPLFTSLNNLSMAPDVLVIPNPSSDVFQVSFEEPLRSNTDYYITNSNGQIIRSNIEILTSELKVDLSTFPSGIYFLHLKNSKEKKAIKLFKE